MFSSLSSRGVGLAEFPFWFARAANLNARGEGGAHGPVYRAQVTPRVPPVGVARCCSAGAGTRVCGATRLARGQPAGLDQAWHVACTRGAAHKGPSRRAPERADLRATNVRTSHRQPPSVGAFASNRFAPARERPHAATATGRPSFTPRRAPRRSPWP